ncbi:kinase-like domain-containing protein, partial [Dipodascopsis uninucleata]
WKFGRTFGACHFVLGPFRRLSKVHFRIWTRVGSNVLLIEDLSTNGTYLNSSRLTKGRSAVLSNGDSIAVGSGVEDQEIILIANITVGNNNNSSSGSTQLLSKDDTKIGTFASQYDLGKVLGSGAFASVRLAVDRESGVLYAAKIISRPAQVLSTAIRREVDILTRLSHPNIVTLHGVFHNPNSTVLLMDYVPGGDLMDLISKGGVLDDGTAATVMRQLLSALDYVHDLGVSHRDIKPDNVLVASKDPIVVKLTDFGLAKLPAPTSALTTFCGTLAYLAPEVLQRRKTYTAAVDMWSIGCLAYVILTSYLPFAGSSQNELMESILSGAYSHQPLQDAGVTSSAQSFIASLLVMDPSKRPTAKVASRFPWI